MKGRVAWLHSPCALIKCYYNSANNRRYFMVELKGRIPLYKAQLLA